MHFLSTNVTCTQYIFRFYHVRFVKFVVYSIESHSGKPAMPTNDEPQICNCNCIRMNIRTLVCIICTVSRKVCTVYTVESFILSVFIASAIKGKTLNLLTTSA